MEEESDIHIINFSLDDNNENKDSFLMDAFTKTPTKKQLETGGINFYNDDLNWTMINIIIKCSDLDISVLFNIANTSTVFNVILDVKEYVCDFLKYYKNFDIKLHNIDLMIREQNLIIYEHDTSFTEIIDGSQGITNLLVYVKN
jgi:hypothetical protein